MLFPAKASREAAQNQSSDSAESGTNIIPGWITGASDIWCKYNRTDNRPRKR